MADIDLIPADYRTWMQQRSLLQKAAVWTVIVNIAVIAAGVTLSHLAARAEQRVADLQSANAITQQQQQQLQQLKDQRAQFERHWSILRGLRAGAEIDDIFTLIDRSLTSKDLWFLDWSFRRAGVRVDSDLRGVGTGYFIIAADDVGEGMEVETHMTIHGQATDHQALSTFVRALFEQRDIRDVNVRRTSRTDYADGRVVEFNMTVVLKSATRGS